MSQAPAASRLDVAVAAGLARTSRWSGADSADRLGSERSLAASARLWITPTVGVRISGEGVTGSRFTRDGEVRHEHPLRRRFVDASVAVRPFVFRSSNRVLQSAYASLGGGIVRASVDSLDGGHSTIPQLAAGVGADLLHVGRSFSVFAEAGVHLYRPSAAMVGPGATFASNQPSASIHPSASIQRLSTAAAAPGAAGIAGSGTLAVGARVSLGSFLPPPPPPPPPPLSLPTPAPDEIAPGTIEVLSGPPGAEVFFVPMVRIRTAADVCALTGPASPYRAGRLDGTGRLAAPAQAQPVTVVIRDPERRREQREDVRVGSAAVSRVDTRFTARWYRGCTFRRAR
jgi:hypothetical protein